MTILYAVGATLAGLLLGYMIGYGAGLKAAWNEAINAVDSCIRTGSRDVTQAMKDRRDGIW